MSSRTHLPPLEKSHVTLAYMRLTDSAPLIMARELGIYREYGLEVTLQREVSWANLRDRLVMGELDAAQMLAPLPMMTSYGAGGIRANLLTGLSLSLNGNAITLSNQVLKDADIQVGTDAASARRATSQLAGYLHKSGRDQPLTLATVHLFSTHTFLLRSWLRAGGIDPDRDVRIIVLPPAQMCDSLARGIIDGYCVGEPWNTVAVQQGIGGVAASGVSVWNNAPEKVLCVADTWHRANPGTHVRLRLALMQACRALGNGKLRAQAGEILSEKQYLDLPQTTLLPSLTGLYQFRKGDTPVPVADFHVFWDYQACFPWRSHAELLVRMSAETLGRSLPKETSSSLIQQCYRPDLYRETARLLSVTPPSSDYKPENRHNAPWEMEPGVILGADRWLE